MKIEINGLIYRISWRYDEMLKTQTYSAELGRVTSCEISKSVSNLEELNSTHELVIRRSVRSFDLDNNTKPMDRKKSLQKALNASTNLFDRASRKLIWAEYKKTQHNDLSGSRIKLKQIVSLISKLPEEDKDKIREKFFYQNIEKPDETKVVTMPKLQESNFAG